MGGLAWPRCTTPGAPSLELAGLACLVKKQSDFYAIGNKMHLFIAWRKIRATPMCHFIRHADTLVKCRMPVNSLADVNKTNKFSPEVRIRAARLVHENRGEYPQTMGCR